VVEYLEWDSHFFGFKIGKVTIFSFQKEEVEFLLQEARDSGFQLLYFFSPLLSPELKVFMEAYQAKLMDEKTTFRKTVPVVQKTLDFTVQPYQGSINESLRELALESGKYSRFKIDDRLAHKFAAMYESWMVNSLNKSIADETLVALMNGQIAGMVTLKKFAGVGKIGIIAVHPDFQGKKIGKALLTATDHWYMNHGISEAEVVTQKENTIACSFYEKNGYQIHKIEYIYHLWLA
jgi:dTDP-4-amino-4,6-dideoxy-D-galactose acyltransferase